MKNKQLPSLKKLLLSTLLTTIGIPAFSQTSPCVSCTDSDPLNAGLMLCYPFNGNANDESGQDNGGTVNGAVLTTDRFGQANKAYIFNGSAEITFDPTDLILNTYSYSVWFKAASNPTLSNIAALLTIGGDQTDQFLLLGNNAPAGGGETAHGIGYGSYFAPSTIPNRYWTENLPTLNTWYHVVLTRSTTTLKFYVNGELKDMRSTGAASASYSGTIFSGTVGSRGGEQYFNGALDDIRIYNRVLSDAEVADLYDCSSPTGVSELSYLSNALAVYPNPARDVLNVHLNNPVNDIKLVNALGETVYEANGLQGNFTIDISRLPAGFYMLMASDKTSAIPAQKIMIE